jgi:phage-related protein
MASFPAINPAYGTVKNSQPKTRIVRFGDGYEQRLNFGINVNPKTYDLTFNVSEPGCSCCRQRAVYVYAAERIQQWQLCL